MGDTTSEPIHICLFIHALGDGGAQRQVVLLANELALRDDVRVTLLTMGGGHHERLVRLPEESWVRISRRSAADLRSLIALRRFLIRNDVDVVVSWLTTADIMAGLVARSVPRSRWVIAIRGAEGASSRIHAMRKWLRYRLSRFADGIIANSDHSREHWERVRPEIPAAAIDNIVAVDVSPENGDHVWPSVVTVGRLNEQKNPITVARAMVSVSRARAHTLGAVIGQGELSAAVQDAIPPDSPVEMLGYRTDAQSLIANASVIVSGSRWEGQPNVLLEAVALGVPIVASRIPEHVELLGVDYPFLVDDLDDPDGFSSAIERVLDDSEAARGALTFAMRRVSAMSASRVAEAYVDAVKKMSGWRSGVTS